MTTEGAVGLVPRKGEGRFTIGELVALLNEGKTQEEAGKELGVTKQAVSLRLKEEGYDARVFEARRKAALRAAAQQLDLEALQKGERLLTPREAAELSGWTRTGIQRAIEKGSLPAQRLGGYWFVTESAVRHWIDNAHHRPGTPPGMPRALKRKAPGQAPPEQTQQEGE